MSKMLGLHSRRPARVLTDPSRRRLRFPLLLLAALLLNVLGVASLTVNALRGQRAELEDTVEAARESSLALLSSQIEQALQVAIQTPFLLLKNLRVEDIDAARIERLRGSFPSVDEVLILDRNLHLRGMFPVNRSRHQHLTTEWTLERLQQERQSDDRPPLELHTFVEEVNGHSVLFAYQALTEATGSPPNAAPETWVLLRFRLDKLISEQVTPLLTQFHEDNDSTALLLEPDDRMPKGHTVVEINSILPGWRLATEHTRSDSAVTVAHLHNLAILSVGAGAVLAIALTVIAGWWEIRREHALLDLRNRFVASVSHELKTPLSLIRMYAETLCLHRQPDPRKQQEYLEIMLRESERLSLMINDVLGFTRVRDGNAVYRMTASDLPATVSEVLEQYRAHFAGRGLQIGFTAAGELPDIAHDPNGITQILLNLLDNAAKYAASGERVDLTLELLDGHPVLAVTDYGTGIPAALRQRLSESFQHGEMVEEAQGSGLGLALVAHIAAAHDARFRLLEPADHPGVRAELIFPRTGATS